MKRLMFFWGLAVLLLSCSEQPRGILSEQKMANIIYDVTLASNCMMTRGYMPHNDSLKKKNFEYVLQKYHVSPAEFDSSAVWYSQHTVKYEHVYTLVITKFQVLQKDLNAEKFKDKEVVRTKIDTINLWSMPRDFHIKPSKVPLLKNQSRNKIPFRIEGSQLNLGDKLLMTFLLNVSSADKATKQRMWIKVHYFPDKTDSLVSYIKNDGKWRKYSLVFPLSSTQTVKYVEGAILDCTLAKGKQHADVDSIRFVHISYPTPKILPKKIVKHKPWYWPF